MNELELCLSDWKWRLNNLYTFIDWNDEKCIFKMNAEQERLFDDMHNKNIILKSRQFGISTYMCIFFLDAILFRKDINVLLVAHTRDDAEALFQNKVLYAYENLAPWLKIDRPSLRETAGVLKIDHGGGSSSQMRVSTSGRSGTYTYIHVSELGKIAARDPQKARELVSGTLNAGLNTIVTIESTAEGDVGIFHDMCIDAEETALTNGHLSRLDYKFFFLPWFKHPLCTMTCPADYEFSPETIKYFADFPHIDRDRQYWYEKKKKEQKDMMTQEFPTTPEEAFSRPLEGAYYGKQMRRMLEDGRITEKLEWDSRFPVYTYCDIGHGDLTVNLYVQYIGRYVHIFDIYVGEGDDNDLESMCNDMKNKPYTYALHIGPHDMGVFEWGAGCTRLEMALNDHGFAFQIAPKSVSVADGIESVKRTMKFFVVNKIKCARFISGLRAYRKGKHPDGSFTGKPNHDQSDFADPARYMCVTSNLVGSEMLDESEVSDDGAVY